MTVIDELAAGLTPWQRRMLDAVLDPGFQGFPVGPRAAGRSTVQRVAIEIMASRGRHVHFSGRDGEWCVTRQQIGFLWARHGR